MADKRRIIVVHAADQTAANEAAKAVTGRDADLETWTVGLSPDTEAPVQPDPPHYWCNWRITDATYSDLISELDARGVSYTDHDGFDAEGEMRDTDEALSTKGLKRNQGPS